MSPDTPGRKEFAGRHKNAIGMRTLITGAGGFLGGYLSKALSDFETVKLGRGQGMDLRLDITSELPDLPGFDMVVHAAGKAHSIPRNPAESEEFHDVNHKGTLNLLDAISRSASPPGSFVLISTVAVYGLEEGECISEKNPLEGKTPYAVSKIQAEQEVLSWAKAHGVRALILRLPLVVGKGAPGNLGAMERHMRRGTYLRIGDGQARRSMVLASDVAGLIKRSQGSEGIYNLTDRHHPSIAELDTCMAQLLGRKVRSIPMSVASILARAGDFIPGSPFDTYRLEKLSRALTFDDDKAVADLGWTPKSVLASDFLN